MSLVYGILLCAVDHVLEMIADACYYVLLMILGVGEK